jgi:RHS repeat-associated protein
MTSRTEGKESLAITYDGFGLPVVTTRTDHKDIETTTATFNGRGLLTKLSTKEDKDKGGGTETTRLRWSTNDAMPQILTQRQEKDRLDSGDRDTDFVYGYGRVSAQAGHDSALFARDAYGSAIRTKDTERWVASSDYDEFGKPKDAEQAPKFGYRGELTTGTDVYLRARTYDSTVGRFTTRDPVATKAGQANPVSAYVYGANDPLNQVDPRGEWPFFDAIFQALSSLTAFIVTQPNPCPGPGNSIDRHTKCLQGHPFEVRGALSQDCLDADWDCLSSLWHNRRPEAAAQAFTINELNKRRAGLWDWGTPDISKEVDWEAGTAYNVHNGFRADIITEERWLFEVKIWHGPATTPEVEAQIRRYIHEFSTYSGDTDSVEMEPSSELQGWIGTFEVDESWWDWLNGGLELDVWGLGLPRGHIYAEDEDDTPEKVRNKKWQQDHPCICHVF